MPNQRTVGIVATTGIALSVLDGRALLISPGIGLVIGTEREWSERRGAPALVSPAYGFFGLLGLAGGLAAVFGRHDALLVGAVLGLGRVWAPRPAHWRGRRWVPRSPPPR